MGAKTFLRREPSDAAVIANSLARPEAFAAIFDRHFGAVHAYLARRVGSARADDLASATFTVAFERRSSFRVAASDARPWLFGIATNLLRNEWRSEQRALTALAWLVPGAVDAAGDADHDQRDAEAPFVALLTELDADQRDVLVLYAWEGFSYQEIASSLGIPVGTVRSRLARARERLRSQVGSSARSGAASGVDKREMAND